MAVSSWVATPGDVTLTLSDGAGTPSTYTITQDQAGGTFPMPDEAMIVVKDRHNAVVGSRKNGTEPFDVVIQQHFREFTNSTADVLLDFVRFTNGAAANTSTAGAGFEHKTVDLAVSIDKTTAGVFHTSADGADAVLTYSDCAFKEASVEDGGETLILSITLTCLSGWAVTGIAA